MIKKCMLVLMVTLMPLALYAEALTVELVGSLLGGNPQDVQVVGNHAYVAADGVFSMLLSFASGAYAGSEGTSGGLVLAQGMNARALGMGESFTAIGGSLASIHYNPAGLGFMKGRQASLLFKRGLAEDNTGALDAGIPLAKGTVAGSFLYYTAGDIELIDSAGVERTVNAQKDYIANISYGYLITRAAVNQKLPPLLFSSTAGKNYRTRVQ